MARNQTVVQDSSGNASVSNNFTAASLIRSGGTSSQFLKADGSVDSNAYVTATGARSALSFVAGSGAYNSSTGVITIPTNTNQLTNGAGFITGYTETDTLATVTARGASTTASISFGSQTRQMINLWSTNYGIGVQSSTTYFRSDSRFSWHRGGSHNDNENNPGGGTVAMTLDGSSNLAVTGSITAGGNTVWHQGNLTNLNQLSNGPGYITSSSLSSYLPLSGGTMTGPLVNNTDGAVIIESNASENNNWLWKENAKQWGLFWFNRGSQSGQTIGTYTTIGAELMFMGGSSGIAMPTGWTGYIAGSNIAAMISNWNGYIYSASTVFAATDIRSPRFFSTSSSGTMFSHGAMTDAFGYNGSYGTYIGSPVGGTYYLYANGTFWDNGTIRTLIHSGNIGSQSVNYATSAGTASNANNLGGLGAASYLKDDGWNNFPGQDANTQGTMFSDFTYSNNAPWTGELIRFGASGYSLQLNSQYQGTGLSFRSRNGDNGTWNSWSTVIHSNNIGSQSVNYANSAGSIAGQANSATITASTGVNASHIVQRDGNGYIYANHINFNTSESENPAINSFFTSNGDGWSRKSSIAHVRNQLGNYGGWITASALSSYLPLSGGTITSRTYLHQAGGGGGQNLFTGVDAPSSANGRGQFILSSAYSDLVIASSQANGAHGSTLSFTTYNPNNAGDYRKFVINQGNWGGRAGFLDFGFADAARTNPHEYINASDDVMSLDGYNKRVGINIMSPSYTLDVAGLVNTASGYISVGNPWGTSNSAFFPNGITTAGGTNWIYGFTYIGNAPANGAGHEFNANGSMRSTSSHRATIYYDDADTTYYVDPGSNGTRAAFLNGNVWISPKSESYGEGIAFLMPSQATWGGLRWVRGVSNFTGAWALGYFGNESNDNIGFHSAGVNGWRLDHSWNMTVIGSVRSPIFYDSENTGFYLDPNSSGTSLNVAGRMTGASWTTSGRNYSNEWLEFPNHSGLYSPLNGAHFYPNNGTYGAWRSAGSRNGWNGIEFDAGNGQVVLMVNPSSNTTGFHNNSYGWQFNWEAGVLYVWKSAYGGGTRATVIDSTTIGVQSVAYANNAGNTSSISNAVGGGYNWIGIQYFVTNQGGYLGSLSSARLQAYSDSNNSAFMSFHKGGHYAVNFGLDADNVMRIGGWSASANRWQLDMSGNMTVAGDVTAFSDARVKENVETIVQALDKVLQLRGVSYNRTDSDDKKTKIGVIAQETLAVVPEVVNQDNAGMYNVSYGNLAGLFIEAFKEQQKQIEDLKSKLDALTK